MIFTYSMRTKTSFGYIEKFVQPCILLLLSKNPSHGYGLLDDLGKHCGHKIDIGNLYRTLRKMEKSKWITSSWQKNKIGPEKRAYKITPDGTAILHEAALTLETTYSLLCRFLNGYNKIYSKGATT